MLIALLAAGVVVIALVVVVVRLRAQLDTKGTELESALAEHRKLTAAVDEAERRAAGVEGERDDALERVNRARRDAAEVATRLQERTDELAALRSTHGEELAELRQAADDARAEMVSAQTEHEAHVRTLQDAAEAATATADPLVGQVAWDLARRQCARTWRVSVALGPDQVCPLDEAEDQLRAAIEIEVDAAREEAGANVELAWSAGDGSPPAANAALAVALVRELLGTLATTAGRTTLTVGPTVAGVEVGIEAIDDAGAPMEVVLPETLIVEPGRVWIG